MIRRRATVRSVGRRVFLLSMLCHAGLVLGLSSFVLVIGKGPEPRPAEFRSDLTETRRLETRRSEAAAPVPSDPEEPPPARLEDPPPVEEPDPFEPLREAAPAPDLVIPTARSVLARPRTEPAPVRVDPPPPPAAAVSAPAVPVAQAGPPPGPSRRARPLSNNQAPRYPSSASRAGIEGLTLLLVTVDEQGRVVRVRIQRGSGSALLDREAARAVRSWTFRPALEDGRAVTSNVLVPIRFQIR